MAKIIVLNGTTCAGKSTLAKQLASKGYIHIDGDRTVQEVLLNKAGKIHPKEFDICAKYLNENDFYKLFYNNKTTLPKIALKKLEKDKLIGAQQTLLDCIAEIMPATSSLEVGTEIFNKALLSISQKKDVVIDTFILDNETMALAKRLCNQFENYFILCFCPLEELQRRWGRRNYEALQNETPNLRSPIFIINDLVIMNSFNQEPVQNYIEEVSIEKWKNLIEIAYQDHKSIEGKLNRFNQHFFTKSSIEASISNNGSKNKIVLPNWIETKETIFEKIKEFLGIFDTHAYISPVISHDIFYNTSNNKITYGPQITF